MKKASLFFIVFFVSLISSAFASTEDVVLGDHVKGYVALAAGFGIDLAAAFGALGQGKSTAAALEGIARNPNAAPKMFTPMIIGLALIETLVIYTLVISFILVGKL